MAVRLTNSQRKVKLQARALRRAAEKALSSLGLEGAELSVLITGDRRMRELNRRYRGLDYATDVLSFPASGAGGAPPFPVMLGDIVISASRAEVQAAEIGHGTYDEMLFLLVHGILHLTGYDHEGGAAERRKMEGKQRELVGLLKAV